MIQYPNIETGGMTDEHTWCVNIESSIMHINKEYTNNAVVQQV